MKKNSVSDDLKENVEGEEREKRPSVNDRRFYRYKLTKQLCICCLMTCLGLCVATLGPTLPDLRDRLNVDYEAASNALVFDSVGVMVGALSGGVLHDYFPGATDLMISGAFAIVAASYISVPWAPSLPALSAILFFGGLAKGNIDIGTNTAVMHMWGTHAAMPMHSLHFAFGVGALSAPQIARPFVGESQDPEPEMIQSRHAIHPNTWHHHDAALNQVPLNTTQDPTIIDDDSSIEYAYLIAGVATGIFSVLYFGGFYLRGFPRGFPERVPARLSLSMCSLSGCGRGSTTRGLIYLALLFIFFLNAVGGELAYATFIYSFATDKDEPLSTGDAANLNTVFFACFTGGRGVGVIVSRFLSTDTLLLLDVILYTGSSLILVFWGYSNTTILWVFSGFTGFFISVLFPGGMAWANKYLDVNGVLVMVLIVGANTGALAYKYLTGALFDTTGPESLMYVNLAAALFVLISFVLMYLVTFKTRQNMK